MKPLTQAEVIGLREALRMHRKNCMAGEDCSLPSHIWDEDDAIARIQEAGAVVEARACPHGYTLPLGPGECDECPRGEQGRGGR